MSIVVAVVVVVMASGRIQKRPSRSNTSNGRGGSRSGGKLVVAAC